MLTAGGFCVLVLGWVLVLAFMRGVGVLAVVVAIIAAGVVGFGDAVATPARTVITSVAPALNAVGDGGTRG